MRNEQESPRWSQWRERSPARAMSMSGTMIPSRPADAMSPTKRSGPMRCTMETLTIATAPTDRPSRAGPSRAGPPIRSPRIASKTPRGVTPRPRASCIDAAITGPSAIGSLNGMPISIAPAPARSSATMMSSVAGRDGSPAVMNGMTSPRFSRRAAAKMSAMRPMSAFHPSDQRVFRARGDREEYNGSEHRGGCRDESAHRRGSARPSHRPRRHSSRASSPPTASVPALVGAPAPARRAPCAFAYHHQRRLVRRSRRSFSYPPSNRRHVRLAPRASRPTSSRHDRHAAPGRSESSRRASRVGRLPRTCIDLLAASPRTPHVIRAARRSHYPPGRTPRSSVDRCTGGFVLTGNPSRFCRKIASS